MSNPGDLLVVGNNAITTAVPNAGSTLDAVWDATLESFGGVDFDGTNLTLDGGKWLIVYSEYFNTTDTTNNERVEIQGEIHSVTNGLLGGFGQGFIRKSSGDQNCVVRGAAIIDSDVDEEVFIRFERTDNSTSGTVNRVAGVGGLYALRLDEAHNYGLYSRATTQSTSGATVLTYGLNTNDEQDTGFTRTGSVIDVANAGRYLVTYSLDISQTATGREDVISYLTNAGAEITGTRGFCYLRGADGCQDGALTWIGILDLPAGADIDLRVQCPTTATINITQGRLQFWQLPATADTVIVEATTGNYNTAGPFTWDTVEHIDTAEFSASAASSIITVDNPGANLVFATLSQVAPDTAQRAVPLLRPRFDGSFLRGAGDGYHRNSGGTGFLAINTSAAFFTEVAGDLDINIAVTGASGTLTNDLGQFSALNLNSIFGDYTPPPNITDVDTDNQILYSQTDVVITGVRFGAIQGTGKVELWDDIAGTTKVIQTIDSWSDTSIQFDVVQGSLPDDTTIYVVVTDDEGVESAPFAIGVGVPPLDDYFTIISNTNPDHWWRFNNDGYADSAGANPITTSVVGGGGAFEATPICEQNTHSWRVNNQAAGARRECANSDNINGQTETTRTMAGWIQFEQIDTALSCLYEEGGGVNNMAVLQGLGGILIVSYADTSDDNAQAYSDFRLEAGRAYHWAWQFDHTDEQLLILWIDGVRQQVTSGNPLTSGDLDSHSGDISFGGPGGSLEVGGTDVTFPTQLDTRYANWMSYTRAVTDAEILDLFRRGAVPQNTISSDTEANMQIAVDALTTSRANEANDIRIFEPSSGVEVDLALDFDGIVFDPGTSIQVEWRGAGTLTITNLNGANTDVTKCVSTRGGTVVVVNPATLTLTGLQNPTEVRVYEAGTQTEVAGQEDVTTGTFSATIQTASVDIVIHSLTEQYQRLDGVDTTSDITLPIQQRVDRNYNNP